MLERQSKLSEQSYGTSHDIWEPFQSLKTESKSKQEKSKR